jgi:hypothetical protein
MCLKFFQVELSILKFAIRQHFILANFVSSAKTKGGNESMAKLTPEELKKRREERISKNAERDKNRLVEAIMKGLLEHAKRQKGGDKK